MKSWPGAPDVLSIRVKIARILRKSGQTAKAKAAYKAIYSDPKVVGSAFDAAMECFLSYGQLLKGNRKKQLAHYREGLRFFEKNRKAPGADKAAKFVAEMRFELLEPEFARYAALEFPADTKKATAILKKRASTLGGLQDKYIEVVKGAKGEWGIAALYRIGTIYGNFADALRAAPCPKKLDQDQCTIYTFTLQDKAYPLVDKAVDAFTQARQKSYELGVYSDYTVKALEELSHLRPEEYPSNAERAPKPDYTSNPYTTADFQL